MKNTILEIKLRQKQNSRKVKLGKTILTWSAALKAAKIDPDRARGWHGTSVTARLLWERAKIGRVLAAHFTPDELSRGYRKSSKGIWIICANSVQQRFLENAKTGEQIAW